MSQAEDLLNTLSETVIDHSHAVPDTDTHFLIDPYTRQIENTNYQKTVLMRGDHNSERFTFEVPRYVDGHDMSLCNRVIVHFDNVGDSIENVYSDVAYMDDLRINPDKPDTVISSWLIRREATQIVGLLSFSIQYQCVESDEVTYEWNTDSYDDIEIRKSKNNGEAAVINYTNVLEQWRSQIFGAGDSVMSSITTEGANQVAAVQTESATQQAAIELKGSETLATIPDDYTEVYNMATEAVRTKADGVVCDAEGEVITVADSSDDYIRGLNVYGKTTQFTTTGAQLAYISDVDPYENNGITWGSNGGIITAKGVAPSHTYTMPYIYADLKGLVGTFYISGNGEYIKVAVQYTRDGVTSYINAPQEFTLDGTETRVELYCQITTYNVDIDDAAYPMVNSGNTELPWEPYTGGMASPNPDYPQDLVSTENPTVNIYGNNLFDEETAMGYWSSTDGAFVSVSDQIASANFIPIPSTFYVTTPASVMDIVYYDVNKDFLLSQTVHDFTTAIEAPEGACYIHINMKTGYGTVYNGDICISAVSTAYEPYVEPQTITLNHALHGAPVATGSNYIAGNYTDENGQEWIGDEVDLERGVLVQRLYSRVFDGVDNETITKYAERENVYGFVIKFTDVTMEELAHTAYCTHFENIVTGISSANKECFLCGAGSASIYVLINKERLSDYSVDAFKTWLSENPITVAFQLATPIETALTAEEIETYKSLKTNYPNTTVLNDASAWMSIKYNADTKLYISNTVETGVVNVVEGVLNDTY